MSKRRHRDRGRNINNGSWNGYSWRNNMNGPMNNYPFGITPQQLLSMFGGNFDMNRLNNILSSMNRNGFDFNSFNGQMNNNNNSNQNGFNNYSAANMNKENTKSNQDDNKESVHCERTVVNMDEIIKRAKHKKIDEENIVFLINLKQIVDDKRQIFIDNIIDILLK